MTGYPPKCPQNGPRNHKWVPGFSYDDMWDGDTVTYPDGSLAMLRDDTLWPTTGFKVSKVA